MAKRMAATGGARYPLAAATGRFYFGSNLLQIRQRRLQAVDDKRKCFSLFFGNADRYFMKSL